MACENPCDCPINKFGAVRAPGVTDDRCNNSGEGEFCEGSLWQDTSTSPETWYIMTDSTCNNAQWSPITGRETLTHFRGYVSAIPQSVPEGDSNIPLNVVVDYNNNPADTWDNINKRLTVDQSGIYLVSGSAFTVINNTTAARWGEGSYFQILAYVNGSFKVAVDVKQPIEYLRGVNSQIQLVGAATVSLSSGDFIEVRVSQRLGQTIDLIDEFGVRNEWRLDRLPDYQPL